MSRGVSLSSFASFALFAALTIQSPAKAPTRHRPNSRDAPAGRTAAAQLDRAYGNLPLAFEPNVGQTDARVRFLARGGGMTAFFTDLEAVMVLSRRRSAEDVADGLEQAVVRMRLAGADPPGNVGGLERLPGVSNYFLGNDPAQWRTGVPHYGRMKYEGVYPGIDQVWYGSQQRLEYDFVVAPGADPKQIKVRYAGVESLWVDRSGDLVLKTALGEIRQQKPRVYQEANGRRVEVAARYTISAPNQVAFELARYDRTRELRIDPVNLAYSTCLGGNGADEGYGIAVDAAGSAYVTGYTSSSNFPTQSPYQATFQGTDVFVTKLSPAGNALVYSTYLGGSYTPSGLGSLGGTGKDMAYAIAVDAAGSAYVTGATDSTNFPTLSAYQSAFKGVISDAFVTKLSPAGDALVYSTYLGGSDDDSGYGIAVDTGGSAYVTGLTWSWDFPVQSPWQPTEAGSCDVFVTKLSPAGSALVYSTFLGGSGRDMGYGIAVDAIGSAYVTGFTASTNFPTRSPYQAAFQGVEDAFVTKLSAAGSVLVYSTYLGGSGQDEGRGIAVDATGSAYIAGGTQSSNFPTQSPYQAINDQTYYKDEAFVTKLSPSGNALVYSTYLGGYGRDTSYGIAVDAAGSAYVTGATEGVNFPIQSAYQATSQGMREVFVTKLSPAGDKLVYSTYLGGYDDDVGQGIAVDAAGSAYITGYSLLNFPTQSPYQPSFAGRNAFVSKLQYIREPGIALNAIVSAASGAGGGVAAGEIAALYGTGLGPTAAVADSGWDPVSGKLPTELGGVSVIFDGQPAPLFYVCAGQINVQVPYEVAGKAAVSVSVTYNGASSAALSVPVVVSHPGVFVYNDRAIITNNATGALITAENPIARGGDVVVWATGPGVVSPPVTTGAPVTTLSWAFSPLAWIGGNLVDVQFAGMTPGMAGLMQINLKVPPDTPTGANVPLKILINGAYAQAYIGGAVTSNLAIAIK
ncbi:MAG: SBBP repeat-containing protein [Bryobacteraceae bacterium]